MTEVGGYLPSSDPPAALLAAEPADPPALDAPLAAAPPSSEAVAAASSPIDAAPDAADPPAERTALAPERPAPAMPPMIPVELVTMEVTGVGPVVATVA